MLHKEIFVKSLLLAVFYALGWLVCAVIAFLALLVGIALIKDGEMLFSENGWVKVVVVTAFILPQYALYQVFVTRFQLSRHLDNVRYYPSYLRSLPRVNSAYKDEYLPAEERTLARMAKKFQTALGKNNQATSEGNELVVQFAKWYRVFERNFHNCELWLLEKVTHRPVSVLETVSGTFADYPDTITIEWSVGGIEYSAKTLQ